MNITEIKAELLKRNLRFVDIDRKYGLNYGSARKCLSYPRADAEKDVSIELGIELKVLFPERYDDKNNKLRPIPMKFYEYKKERRQGIVG